MREVIIFFIDHQNLLDGRINKNLPLKTYKQYLH